MKRIIKQILAMVIICSVLIGTNITTYAKEIYAMDGEVLYSGSNEECETYSKYVRRKYMIIGSGYYPDGRLSCLTYSFGEGQVKFDFEKMKMTWIDGSKWNITNMDYGNKSKSAYFVFADDAIRLFCPEFAQDHSLIPEGAPANFSTVIEKARSYNDKRLGITRSVASTNVVKSDTQESFETFNAVDYANRYQDVKNALGTDKNALWEHYQKFGKAEGRKALFDVPTSNAKENYERFNAMDYANRYPDVKDALGIDKNALWTHYQTYGKIEGRTAVFN